MTANIKSFGIINRETFLTCPFDATHKISRKKWQSHLIKCAKNHQSIEWNTCIYDQTHIITGSKDEFKQHLRTCPERYGTVADYNKSKIYNIRNDPISSQTFEDNDISEDWTKPSRQSLDNCTEQNFTIHHMLAINPFHVERLTRSQKRQFAYDFGKKEQQQLQNENGVNEIPKYSNPVPSIVPDMNSDQHIKTIPVKVFGRGRSMNK